MAQLETVEMDGIFRTADGSVCVDSRDKLLKGLTTSGVVYLHFGSRTRAEYKRITERSFDAARTFFARGQSEKALVRHEGALPAGVTRGYLAPSSEAGGAAAELKEALSWSAADVSAPANTFQYPNVWPSSDHGDTQAALDGLFTFLFEVMVDVSRALGHDVERECHAGRSISLARAFHYFPSTSSNIHGIGSAPHTDWGLATLVVQQADSDALQVCDEIGRWVPVIGKPNTLVLNGSDFLALLTKGKLKSPLHRVVLTPSHRYSFVYFQYPGFETPVPPLSAVDEDTLRSLILLRDQGAPEKSSIQYVREGESDQLSSLKVPSSNQATGELSKLKLLSIPETMTFGELMALKWSQVARGGRD